MAEYNKFKDITDEELATLIKERQKKFPSKKKLSVSQLTEGIENDHNSSKIIEYVCNILRFLLIVPNIAKLIVTINEYKQYAEIVKSVINTNDKFYDFLEKYHFYPVRFTRLMSVQQIPEQFIGLSDEELLAITTRSLFPIRKIVEETRLLEILTIKIVNRKVHQYAILLEPKNFYDCIYIVKQIFYSICFYAGIITIYILCFNSI